MMRAVVWAVLFAVAGAVSAQDVPYPARPIRMVVPYPPGGVTDIAVRLVAPKMSEALGQPIVIENQATAGGVVATNAVARATPDGYTLIATFDSFATNPFLYNGVQHDPLRDFAPISLMLRSPQLLVVHPGAGIRTIAELIRVAKEQGDRLSFGTAGQATSSRFSAELFKQLAGVEFTLISYKGGAPVLNDLLGGQVTGLIASASLVLPHAQRGKLVALGVSSAKRLPQLPDLPTIAETLSGFEAQSWTGMLAPAATPRPVIDRVNSVLVAALAANDVREKLSAQGVEIVGSTPEMFGEWLKSESAKWGRVIRERRIKLD